MTDKKETFIMNTKYLKYAKRLSDEEFGKLMRIVFIYQDSGIEPEEGSLSVVGETLFDIIKTDLDENAQKYAEICEKRREIGKKGGRPKKEMQNDDNEEVFSENQNKAKKANGFSENQNKAKKADNDSEDDNEYEYDCDYEGEDEADNEYDTPSASVAHNAYKELIGDVTPRVVEVLEGYKLSEELKIKAIEEAHDNNKKSIAYIKAILDRFVKAKILTIEDWERSKANHKGVNPYAYDFDEIERMNMEKLHGKKLPRI